MSNVIDARFIFTAKRDMVHVMLITGTLQRACPMGGEVVRFPEKEQPDWAAIVREHINEAEQKAVDEWAWLEQFDD